MIMTGNVYKTFMFIAFVVIILLLMHLLPPIRIGEVQLRNVDILSDLSIVSDSSNMQLTDNGIANNSIRNGLLHSPSNAKWQNGIEPIEDYSTELQTSMIQFYNKLDSIDTHKQVGHPVRIAIYGDSFIEGDILVAELRESLQAKYGGNGVGWTEIASELTQLRPSVGNSYENIDEHFVMRKETYRTDLAGLSERYYTTHPGSWTTFTATSGMPHARLWNQTSLFLKSSTPSTLKVTTDNGEKIYTLQASDRVQVLNVRLSTPNVSFRILSGQPILYGACHDGLKGVCVDNFSMRGSSGVTLANLPPSTLADFNRLRHYDLIILEYGANAISENPKPDDIKWYMKNMNKVIRHFKQCFPNTTLMVMSTPDRGARVGNRIGTMKGIKELVVAQQKLARDNHVAFYNLYSAMGGEGSIGRLVKENHASKDYIHMKRSGGAMLASTIMKSIEEGRRINNLNKHE